MLLLIISAASLHAYGLGLQRHVVEPVLIGSSGHAAGEQYALPGRSDDRPVNEPFAGPETMRWMQASGFGPAASFEQASAHGSVSA